RPSAIRVSVINDRVDPASGTWRLHTPGLCVFLPITKSIPLPIAPKSSWVSIRSPRDVLMIPTSVFAVMPHMEISPRALVTMLKSGIIEGVVLVSVCTPSDKVKAVGVTVLWKSEGRGSANVKHYRHEVARGVGAVHLGEWVPCVPVRGGNGL